MAPEPVEHLRPMLATAGRLPTGVGWAFEFKWDGVRAIVTVNPSDADGTASKPSGVRAMSRNDRDISGSYPELDLLVEAADGRRLVIDGEIVAVDKSGRPDFGLLQQRMHVQHPTPSLQRQTPASYFAFDLLAVDGESLVQLPYSERRDRLEALSLPRPPTIDVPPSFRDVAGEDLLEVARTQGLEGVVAKRLSSRYVPGRRSSDWVKVPLWKTIEVVVGGWQPGEGGRANTIGSLLLGVYDDELLTYIGHVGTGFTEATLRQLRDALAPLARDDSPFANEVPPPLARKARWVEPTLVGEVMFRTWTHDRRLRHSTWRGLRADKDPTDVVMPTAGR
jgi:bifunctional non-homologous end joining protein LigD